MQTLPPDQTNIERGAIGALYEIAALPELLISHWKEIQNARPRVSGDDTADFAWKWGAALFADDFRARNT